MSVEELLRELDAWHGGIPVKLLETAVARQEEVTPGLIAALEDVAAHSQKYADDPERGLYFWAAYLLAHFTEERAFPAMLRLFELNRDFAPLVEEMIVEDGALLLANVCGGDAEPIVRMMRNASAPSENREAAATALGFLCAWGELDEERVEEEYRAVFQSLTRQDGMLSMTLLQNSMDLNLRGLQSDITRAHDLGAIDDADFDDAAEWLHDPDYDGPPPFMHLNQAIDDIVEFFENKIELEETGDEGGDFGRN